MLACNFILKISNPVHVFQKCPYVIIALSTSGLLKIQRLTISQTTSAKNYAPQNPCSETREATAMRSLQTTTREEPLLPATRESPHAVTETHSSQK